MVVKNIFRNNNIVTMSKHSSDRAENEYQNVSILINVIKYN